MAILNFPSSPTTNQEYTGDNGTTYKFDGVKWVSLVTTGGNVNFMITLSKAVSALSIPQLSYVTLVPVGAIGANTVAGTWA
jgi:hypothetical protein